MSELAEEGRKGLPRSRGTVRVPKTPAASIDADAEAAWQPADRFSLSGHIIAQIKGLLFAKKLRPGDFLGSEASVAEKFGVSRMAARDALRSLEALGIITIRKGARGGIWVAQGDPDRLADAVAIQINLIGISKSEVVDAQFATEVETAELAAHEATQEDLDLLFSLCDAMEASIADRALSITMIIRFHIALAEASHNRTLITQVKAYMKVMANYYAAGEADLTRRQAVHSRYRSLVEAIALRNREAARSIMIAHMSYVRRDAHQ